MSKNFVWLIFDSVRGDHTSIGGYERDTTPTLARVGRRDDAVATTCFSHAMWSQPSVASMLTGTPPSRHGAGLHNETLPTELTTVPERLGAAGYVTSGLSVNPFFSETTGADRGFDEFDYYDIGDIAREVGLGGLVAFLRNVRRFSAGFTPTKRKHTPDFLFNELVQQRATALAEGDRPFFLCAHYHGAHHSYCPSPAFRDRFYSGDDVGEATEFAFQHSKDVYEEIANGCQFSDEEWETIRSMYDAQVYQTDALIDRLLSHLETLGLDDNTVVVITSDHGELLGEYDLMSHKLALHDALLEVPLVVRGSERFAGADYSNVQHIDVMQTVLDELGANTDGMCGEVLPDHDRDFVVAQRGAETRERTMNRLHETNPSFSNDKIQSGLVHCFRQDGWKYLRGADSTFLYELPDEETDRSADRPELCAEYDRRLDEWLDRYGSPLYADDRADFGDDVKQQLADLGYVTD